MNESLNRLCQLFITNRNKLKGAMKWESTYMYPVCACVYTEKGMIVDEEKLKSTHQIMKNKTGVFSTFRELAKFPILTMIDSSGCPERRMEEALTAYAALKKSFSATTYLPLIAVTMAENVPNSRYEEIAVRAKTIYQMMSAGHPFLTSQDDSMNAFLLALLPVDNKTIIQHIEECYQILNKKFPSNNASHSLSQVLTMYDGTASEKCARVINLYDSLKARGKKYGKDYELASLGVLAMLPVELHTLIDAIIEVDSFLSKQKDYGFFGIGEKQRLMHAGMIVSCEYKNEKSTMNPAINGVVSMVVAQQMVMCAAIASSAAASAASN